MAEYTQLTENEIKGLLKTYPIGCLESCSPMAGGQANSSYQVTTDQGRFILSVCDEKNDVEIDALTRVLEYLESKAFPTSRVVRTADGGRYIRFRNKPVYLKRYMTGEVIQDLTQTQMSQVGRVMAGLHEIPALDIMPDRFPYGMDYFDEVFSSGLTHEFVDWLKVRQEWLVSAIDPDSAKGFIHGDVFWDNLLFEGGRLIAVLDFEEACRYYTLYDIGMCLTGCCRALDGLDFSKAAGLIQGYQTVHPLSKREKDQLKVFTVYAAVVGAFWRFRQYNVYYPGTDKRNSYQELSGFADAVYAMPDAAFKRLFA